MPIVVESLSGHLSYTQLRNSANNQFSLRLVTDTTINNAFKVNCLTCFALSRFMWHALSSLQILCDVRGPKKLFFVVTLVGFCSMTVSCWSDALVWHKLMLVFKRQQSGNEEERKKKLIKYQSCWFMLISERQSARIRSGHNLRNYWKLIREEEVCEGEKGQNVSEQNCVKLCVVFRLLINIWFTSQTW